MNDIGSLTNKEFKNNNARIRLFLNVEKDNDPENLPTIRYDPNKVNYLIRSDLGMISIIRVFGESRYDNVSTQNYENKIKITKYFREHILD